PHRSQVSTARAFSVPPVPHHPPKSGRGIASHEHRAFVRARTCGRGAITMRGLRGTLRRIAISALALVTMQHTLLAHTVSIGYIITGPGAVNIWYGSYHVGANFNEGSLRLVGPSYNQVVPFFLLSAVKPTGLVDGTNNFYSNGTSLTGIPVPISG